MTKENWDIDKITKEEIVLHLKEHHQVPFNDRSSLTETEFREDHFPELTKYLEEEKYGYLSEKGKNLLKKFKQKLRDALIFCEEEKIPIARVFDEIDGHNESEWRICKPTQEQLNYLKQFRWFRIAAGNFCKVLYQSEMLGDVSEDNLKLLSQELEKTVILTWKEKQRIIEKRNKRKEKNI